MRMCGAKGTKMAADCENDQYSKSRGSTSNANSGFRKRFLTPGKKS
jgi:hypothetical protein